MMTATEKMLTESYTKYKQDLEWKVKEYYLGVVTSLLFCLTPFKSCCAFSIKFIRRPMMSHFCRVIATGNCISCEIYKIIFLLEQQLKLCYCCYLVMCFPC